MPGRVNHRGWIVLESIASTDGGRCVDFFEDPAGGFGFEHLRADPEDAGSWTAVGSFGGIRFGSPLEAASAARDSIAWLDEDQRGQRAVEEWLTHLRSGNH